jgi:hypothetical protein
MIMLLIWANAQPSGKIMSRITIKSRKNQLA